MSFVTPELCARAELLSRTHPVRTVSEIVGLSTNTLYFLKKRGWKPISRRADLRPRPSDFAIQLKTMSHEELCKHYRASSTSIGRWKRELRL